MKISRKFCWGLVALLFFVGLILLAGGELFGGSEENGQGVAYFCAGGGLLIGLLLIIEWLVGVQKCCSEEEKAAERRGLCPDGLRMLQKRNEARTEKERGNWNLKWGDHRKKCGRCQGRQIE